MERDGEGKNASCSVLNKIQAGKAFCSADGMVVWPTAWVAELARH